MARRVRRALGPEGAKPPEAEGEAETSGDAVAARSAA